MPAPILHEPAILEALSPQCPITPDGFRQVLKFLLMDCADRGVKREFFEGAIDKCLELEHAFTRFMCILCVIEPFKKQEIPTPALDEAAKTLGKEIVFRRNQLCELLEQVMECPHSESELH